MTIPSRSTLLIYKLTFHVKTKIIIVLTCATFVQKSTQSNLCTGCNCNFKHFYMKYNQI